MLTEENIFPTSQPPGYEYLADEPAFDPSTDLCLAKPAERTELDAFDYDDSFIRDYPASLAITSPLRILSDTGVAKLRAVVEQLRQFTIWGGSMGAPGIIRGSAYRSRFVRDLCLSSEVAEFLGNIAEVNLVPTALGHQLAHINVPPRDDSDVVGAWHIDQNSYVLVLALHDPAEVAGGRFQYYRGHRHDALRELRERGELSADLAASVTMPGPGWGVLMQGSAIVHRAEPRTNAADRVTVVTSYEPVDVSVPDQNPQWFVGTGYEDDPNGRLEIQARLLEFARHKAWRTRGKLDDFIRHTPWDASGADVVRELTECMRDVLQACKAIQRGTVDPQVALREFADQVDPRT